MEGLLSWMSNLISNIGNALAALLPLSPFTDFIDNFVTPEYMGWLNWFFPVSEFLTIVSVWLTAVSLFLLYSIIMRWVKMIGD